MQQVRAEGFPDYRVWPEGQREMYTSILYLEPFRDRNLRAFGYDMFSEPVRRTAMERARDSGDVALSGKVELVQETGEDTQAGALMYVPVYRNGEPVETIAQRRAAHVGWTYSPYRMDDLMRGILERWRDDLGKKVHFKLYEGNKADPARLLFNGPSGHAQPPDTGLSEQRTLDFGGTRWLLVFLRSPETGVSAKQHESWLAFLFGSALSILLFLFLRSVIRTREEASQIALNLTKDLRESEYRWKFAIEGSGDGLWDWNMADGTVLFSRRWKKMLGYDESEIGNGLDEWEQRIHPHDRDKTLAEVQDYLDGKSTVYRSEHRVRCKDGSYKWMLDRGIVVSRSDDGTPLRMIGTHSDISEMKRQDLALRQSREELLEAQRIAKVGSWTAALKTGKVFWTRELYRMMGLDQRMSPPDLRQQEALFTPESWVRLSAAISLCTESGTPYEIEAETIRFDGNHGWLLARGEPTRDPERNIVGLRGTATDITERKQAQIRIEGLTRLYAALSECNSAIVHCATQEELFARICQVVVQQGRMAMAWIGLVDDASGRILPVNSHGVGTEHLEDIVISIDADDPHGRGPTGTAVRENRPVWADNLNSNPATRSWQGRAAEFGLVASAALPICRDGKPIGALTFYATTGGWFDEDTRSLLAEIAGDINFALDKYAVEAVAKTNQARLIQSEQRFQSLVEQSIAGAFILQEGRIVYANPRLAEILGYSSGEDLIGRAPLDLVDPKDRDYIAKMMSTLYHREVKKVESVFTALRRDGTRVEVGSTSILAFHQSAPALIGLFQDISDKKVAEDQIKRYTRQLEHTFIQTVNLATTLSEMRDPYTAGHEQRVAEIAVAIGREMGLDENRVEGLRVGGHLHDVGKITVPSEILSKPTKLTQNEYALIKEHARAGYEVLKNVDFPWPVAQIALQHHERIDGSGYPQGLKGEEILLEARITAVADVVESMASHRPYRPALGIEKALVEIEHGSGTAYDPVVVDTCLRLFRHKGYALPLQS